MKTLLLALLFAFQAATAEEPKNRTSAAPINWFSEASYYVACELGDPPTNPAKASSNKHFEDLKKCRILQTRTHLNQIGLTAQTIHQKLLSKDQIAELTKATFKSTVHYPVFDCYDPHHVFVFYDDFGKPVACIEVCFECNAIKYATDLTTSLLPKVIGKSENESDPFSGGNDTQYENWPPFRASGDFLAIAKICIHSGMGLGKFKTLEEFEKARQPSK
jgi:hypothetical protein